MNNEVINKESNSIEQDRIVIIDWQHVEGENLNLLANHDPELVASIMQFSEMVAYEDDIETFSQIGNIIITDNGCYGAFFESELRKYE